MKTEQPHKSKLTLVKIPSGGEFLVGRMFIAAGQGPHPTILLLHGFPGTALNLDIASKLQQVGYNVLVIHYRGAWGSQGSFSFLHSLEDVQATLTFIRKADVASEHRIDTSKIILIGHSFGGFLALKTASVDPTIQHVAALSPVNFGVFGQLLLEQEGFENRLYSTLKESAFFLNGSTPEMLLNQIRTHQADWNTVNLVPTLLNRHFCLTAASDDAELPKAYFHDPLVQALTELDPPEFEHHVFETDHAYMGVRDELTQTLLRWLQKSFH